MKKVLFIGFVVMLTACQTHSMQKTAQPMNINTQMTSAGMPCTNGFDDVNVCQLRS